MKKLMVLVLLFTSFSVGAAYFPKWFPKGGDFTSGQIVALSKNRISLMDKPFLLASNVKVATMTKSIGSLADIKVGDHVLLTTFTKNQKEYVDYIFLEAHEGELTTP